MKKKIETILKNKKISQVEVAKMLGISKQSFKSRCYTFDKNNGKGFTHEELKKMADFIGEKSTYFFGI
ncbi:MAG: hypothetical protein ACRC6J_04460 [Cetobacterium sp.]